MEGLMAYYEQADGLYLAMLSVAVLVLWFLPAMLAMVFNRKHFKVILVACVPAGFSLIAWSGLMVWALTGKVADKYRTKPADEAA